MGDGFLKPSEVYPHAAIWMLMGTQFWEEPAPVHIFLAATAEITFSVCVWGGDTKQYHQHGYGFILSFKMVFIWGLPAVETKEKWLSLQLPMLSEPSQRTSHRVTSHSLSANGYTLLNVAVDLAAQYCNNLQYNTAFLYYSKVP